jgi:hypothetical protein
VASVLGLGREATAPAAIYEELDVRVKPTKASGRRRSPSSVSGSVTSERKKKIPLTCGPGMSVREREGRARQACGFGRLGWPNTRRAAKRGWLAGFGPNKKRDAAGPRREERRPAGQNRDEEGFHFYFSFLIFQLHF